MARYSPGCIAKAFSICGRTFVYVQCGVIMGIYRLRPCASPPAMRDVSECTSEDMDLQFRLTRQGLFSSKPAGATGLSVCPLRKPVNLLSRSITRVRQFEKVLAVLGALILCWEIVSGGVVGIWRQAYELALSH